MACLTLSRRRNWTHTSLAWKVTCARPQRNLSLKKPPSFATWCAICARRSFCLLEGGRCVQLQPLSQRHEFIISAAPVQPRQAGGLCRLGHAVPEIRFVIE